MSRANSSRNRRRKSAPSQASNSTSQPSTFLLRGPEYVPSSGSSVSMRYNSTDADYVRVTAVVEREDGTDPSSDPPPQLATWTTDGNLGGSPTLKINWLIVVFIVGVAVAPGLIGTIASGMASGVAAWASRNPYPYSKWKVHGDHVNNEAGDNAGKVIITYSNDHRYQEFGLFQALWGDEGDYFGTSVSMCHSALSVVVGAQGTKYNGASSGSLYVFNLVVKEGRFSQRQRLDGGAEGDMFGRSVDMNDNGLAMAVAASGTDVDFVNSGSIHVFMRESIGEPFVKKYQLNGQCEEERLGSNGVAILTNNTLQIHAKAEDVNNCISNVQNVRSYRLK